MAAISSIATVASVASAASSIAGAFMGSDAASTAADQQAASSQAGINEQAREFNQIQANNQPWVDAGKAGLGKLKSLLLGTTYEQDWNTANNAYVQAYNDYMNLSKQPWSVARDQQMAQLATKVNQLQKEVVNLNPNDYKGVAGMAPGSLMKPFTGADLQNEPGYQFGLQQGELGVNRAASAAGRYDSGATLKALTRFNEDYAGTKYNEAFNRDLSTKQNAYNMLAGLSGVGQTATANTNAAGMNAANNTTNLLTGIGNAQAAGTVGSANAWNAGLSGASNSLMNYSLLQKLLSNGGGNNSSFWSPSQGGWAP